MANISELAGRPGPNGEPPKVTFRVRWRDPDGRSRSKTFKTSKAAVAFRKTVDADLVRGTYLDPAGPRTPIKRYALQWQSTRLDRSSTAELVDSHIRNHIIPGLGRYRLGDVRPSHVRAFVKQLQVTLAPATTVTVYAFTRAMFRQAVDDRLIASSPCVRIPLPRLPKASLIPLTTDQVVELTDTATGTHRTMIIVAAATGLRSGELLGLTVDRLNLLRREVRVDRQLYSPSSGPPVHADVKGHAHRTVPLPQVAVDELAAHLAAHPPDASGFVFTTSAGQPWRRNRFNEVMRRIFDLADLPDASPHSLRHYYASLLIASGASVKVVQNRLGHSSAVETLDTYGHLWPDSEDDTREAVDRLLGERLVSKARQNVAG